MNEMGLAVDERPEVRVSSRGVVGKAPQCAQEAPVHNLRGILEANEHVVLCEANASLGIEWVSSNARRALGGQQQRGSVLSLVAPESRGFVSRAIFRAARETTTRVRVRSIDGRDADLVVVAQNEYLRRRISSEQLPDDPRLSKASGSSYAIGLFIFDRRRPPGVSAESDAVGPWTAACAAKAAHVGAELAAHGDCLCVMAVVAGRVATAVGGCEAARASGASLTGASPLAVVAPEDRTRVATAFADAKRSGAKSSCQIHRCAGGEVPFLALSTCAFDDDGGGGVVASYFARHRPPASMTESPSLANIARSLSIDDTHNRKRKRTLSTAVLEPPRPRRALFDERRATSAHLRKRRSSSGDAAAADDDDDWGHFVFPDGDPDFNLPPIDITQCSHRAAAYRTAPDDLPREAQPKESTRIVIDIDSLLPREQSIENYQKALAQMGPAPAPRYSALALDSLLNAVLPRPESIAAFRASMREITRRRGDENNDDDDDMVDDDLFSDTSTSEHDDVLADLVDSTTFGRARCDDISASFSRLFFPLDEGSPAPTGFSVASEPVPMDAASDAIASAVSSSSSSSSAAAVPSSVIPRGGGGRGGKPQSSALPVKPRRQVHIVG